MNIGDQSTVTFSFFRRTKRTDFIWERERYETYVVKQNGRSNRKYRCTVAVKGVNFVCVAVIGKLQSAVLEFLLA